MHHIGVRLGDDVISYEHLEGITDSYEVRHY